MTFAIREITTLGEVEALEPIFLEYFGVITDELRDNFNVELDPKVPVATMMQKLDVFLAPLGRSFVAEDAQGALVGTVFLRPLAGPSIELKRLYVRPGVQGQGLGRLLLIKAKDVARTMGARTMYLDTLKSLAPAIALYQKDGFELVPPYEGAEIVNHPDILPHAIFMRREL